MEPTAEQLARLALDVERSRAPQPVSALMAALELEDRRFIDLLRLRRELRRTKWWQVRRIKRINREVKTILDAQKESLRAHKEGLS